MLAWIVHQLVALDFPQRCIYKVLLVRLYKPLGIFSLGGEALSRAEPPAGPPKSTKSLGEVSFPKIPVQTQNFRPLITHQNKLT